MTTYWEKYGHGRGAAWRAEDIRELIRSLEMPTSDKVIVVLIIDLGPATTVHLEAWTRTGETRLRSIAIGNDPVGHGYLTVMLSTEGIEAIAAGCWQYVDGDGNPITLRGDARGKLVTKAES